MAEQKTTLTPEVIELIKELRKPVKTAKEVREEEQAEQDRLAMMETLKVQERNRIQRQEDCSHMRPNGSTTAVYIADIGKLYCQACADWIAPNEKPALFNRLYQLAV